MYENNNHSELEQEYNSDERNLKIINEHRDYYYEMLGFLENIEKKGPSTVIEPKKPTSKIPTLNQSKSNRLIGYKPNPNIPFNEITFKRIRKHIKQCASYEERLNNDIRNYWK